MEIKLDLPTVTYVIAIIICVYNIIKEHEEDSSGYFGGIYTFFVRAMWFVMLFIVTLIFGGLYWW